MSEASGRAPRGIVQILDQRGFWSLFGSLHCVDAHPSKPDLAMLQAAMATASVGPEQTVMAGDSVFDFRIAGAAGVPSLGNTWDTTLWPNSVRPEREAS